MFVAILRNIGHFHVHSNFTNNSVHQIMKCVVIACVIRCIVYNKLHKYNNARYYCVIFADL